MADEMSCYLTEIDWSEVLMVENEEYEKNKKYIFDILSINFKKVLKEKISKHCLTGDERVDIL